MDLENCTVQYLHRTVKDYIESADVQRKLILSMKSSYDRYFAHCVGLLILIRTRPLALPLLKDVKIWTLIDQFLYHASKVGSPNYAPLLSMMDSLNSTCSLIAQRSVGLTKDLLISMSTEELQARGHWAIFHPYVDRARIYGGHYISLVVRNGVMPFIKRSVHGKCLVPAAFVLPLAVESTLFPLLLDAIGRDRTSGISEHDKKGPNVEVVTWLLEKGADPNHKMGFVSGRLAPAGETVWQITLDNFATVLDDLVLSLPYNYECAISWASVCRIMLEYGAGEFSAAERRNAIHVIEIYLSGFTGMSTTATGSKSLLHALNWAAPVPTVNSQPVKWFTKPFRW